MSIRLKKIVFNWYFIIFLIFGLWMLFYDDNSLKIHRELNEDIDKLEHSIEFYNEEIEKDKKVLEDYEDKEKLEKFVRETYQMKKDSEDIYIIEIEE